MNKKVTESARMQAQDLTYQAMSTHNPAEVVQLCKQAIGIDPRCVDALSLLSGLIQNADERIDRLYYVASIAEEDLGGKSYMEENGGHFWGLLETRPYMRARLLLAEALQDAGRTEASIKEYETLLYLNPNDNQGVRYTLIGLYLETDNLNGVHCILDEYDDEKSAVFTWSAVLENLISGDIESAALNLIEARKHNPYVESYLLGKIPIPMQAPECYRDGDRNEAIICAMTIGNAWQKNSAAMSWLRMNESEMPVVHKNKTGRNDPCPCGSGKKYKKCCLGLDDAPAGGVGSPMTSEIALNDIQRELDGKSFTSQEEANDFSQEFNQKRNSTPIDDFVGLSTAQMHRIINFPFDSPDIVEFPSVLATAPTGPSAVLFEMLADAVGEEGLKPTAKGNLPLKVVCNIAITYMSEDEYARYTKYGNIRSEENYQELHVTRIIAGIAGLIHKYKGKFILSRKGRKMLKDNGMSGIYPILLRAYMEKFNWGYLDQFVGSGFIQYFVVFSLYLLSCFGDQWRENTFYEDAFLRAFPTLVDTVEPIGHFTQEELLRNIFSLRCLERFAEYMGLVEIERNPGDRYSGVFRVKKTPMLDDAVRFHI